MLVFATKIPIKSDVTEQMFIDICAEWVYGSPHYHNIDIKYDISNHCDYEIVKDNGTWMYGHSYYLKKNE